MRKNSFRAGELPEFPKPLIVGLGNPGFRYSLTRHNAGFLFVDSVVLSLKKRHAENLPIWNERDDYAFFEADSFVLLKPYTYMNLSFAGVISFLREEWHLDVSSVEISCERFLVVHDDMDIEPGFLKFSYNRGHGGHNGVKSLYNAFGSSFWRLRIGIGRPQETDTVAYVLSNFTEREIEQLGWIMESARSIIEGWVRNPETASSKYNSKKYQEQMLKRFLTSESRP